MAAKTNKTTKTGAAVGRAKPADLEKSVNRELAARTETPRRAAGPSSPPKGRRSQRETVSEPGSIAKTVDQMAHGAKSTVAGAGGFSTNPGSMRPQLGALAGLDPEGRRVDDLPHKRSERKDTGKPAPKKRPRK